MSGRDAALHARTRFVCLALYCIAAFHAATPLALGICLTAAVVCAVLAGMNARSFVGVLRPLAPILVVTVVFQVLYIQSGRALVQLGPVAVTYDALAASARMLVCLLCVMVVSAAFMKRTALEELMDVLEWLLCPLRRAGIRVDGLLFSLTAALRFVPVLVADFEQLKKSQQARLVQFEGGVSARLTAYARLFAPLLRGAFRRADALAEAAVSRCFGSGVRRSARQQSPFSVWDAAGLIVAVALAAVCFCGV